MSGIHGQSGRPIGYFSLICVQFGPLGSSVPTFQSAKSWFVHDSVSFMFIDLLFITFEKYYRYPRTEKLDGGPWIPDCHNGAYYFEFFSKCSSNSGGHYCKMGLYWLIFKLSLYWTAIRHLSDILASCST